MVRRLPWMLASGSFNAKELRRATSDQFAPTVPLPPTMLYAPTRGNSRMNDTAPRLHRSLSAAQLSMIAIGGAIGTGLFLGSGFAISIAGPGVILSYVIGGMISLFLMGALAEMTVAHPTAGSFGVFADRYLGSLGGFVIRWAYVSSIALAVGTEVTAIAIYMGYWWPGVPGIVWIVGFSGVLIAINMADVTLFGSVEYALSLIKILAIVAFIGLGLWWVFGPSPLPGAGLANYTRDGLLPQGMWGVWVAVFLAIFSYFSIEMIAVAAGEAAEPQRAIVQAFRATIARLLIFYLATIALMLAIVPWTEAGRGGSPFVIVAAASGLRGAGGVVNGVILIAALSAMNSQLYVASRMLFSLGEAGYAPRGLTRLSGAGVPQRAVALASGGIAVAVAAFALQPATAFTLMISASACGGATTWILIFATHVAFRRAGGVAAGGFRMSGAPLTSWIGGLLMVGVLVTTAFTEAFRLTLVVGVPFLLALLVIHRLAIRPRAAVAA